MAFKDIIEKEQRTAYMLTNEAIVRAALEADVKVVSFYPGSPQTEILDNFEKATRHFDDFKMEIAANEKVALETVAGASMVGMRSLTSMKSVGTNVASDALYSLAYTGVRGGCVCCISDDPHAHSSQSEQDGRWFAYSAYLPMLEPSNPREAMDMVKEAFELSQRHGTIVMVRNTTRVNHQSGMVELGDMQRTPFEKLSWKDNPRQYKTVGAAARSAKLELLAKMDAMKKELADSPLNRTEFIDGSTGTILVGNNAQISLENAAADGNPVELGIITAGDCYNYAAESLLKMGIRAKVLKLGVINPLPESLIADFIRPLKQIMVVEELFPYLEDVVARLAKDANPSVEIIGKRSGHFKENFEYDIPIVSTALAQATGAALPFDYAGHVKEMTQLADILPARLPVFCAGCPHRATFWALQKAVRKPENVFFSNDIGCYSMMCLEPMNWTDSLLCMGASMGIGAGAQYASEEPVIAVMGDSTFFHAGMPGIANAVHNDDNITLFILDNSVTAMTGQQTHPAHANKAGGAAGRKINIESVLLGLGIPSEHIFHINSYEVRQNIGTVKKALAVEGVSVVLSHQECALYHFRNYRHSGGKIVPFYIDTDVCKRPYNCIKDFMCPAISIDPENGASRISPELCVGCGVCAQICPHGAIKSTATLHGGEDKRIIELDDYRAFEELKRKHAESKQKHEETGSNGEEGKDQKEGSQ